MGSIIDYIACPNCKTEAYSDFYYKTGEEYINCNNCGYHRSAIIVNRDKPLNKLTENDWSIKELKNPYGSYRYRMAGESATTCGSLTDEDDRKSFEISIHKYPMDLYEFIQISRYINGEIIVENLK